MSTHTFSTHEVSTNQALETSIQIGLAALLVIGCLAILFPFVPLIMWGIIIAIASYPGYLKLQRILNGRVGLAAAVWTLLLLVVLILPCVLLIRSLLAGIQPMAAAFREGSLVIPPPP